jgi:hypothetical protein
MSKMSFSEKMSLAAGSASLAFAPAVGNAGLVTVNPAPGTLKVSLSSPDNTTVAWDVDGAGGIEFRLEVQKIYSAYSNIFALELNSRAYVAYGVYDQFNGRGFVAQLTSYGGGVHRGANVLPSSFNVGPTLAGGYLWGRAVQRSLLYDCVRGSQSGIFVTR